jgi:quinol monooxygenase YgiN
VPLPKYPQRLWTERRPVVADSARVVIHLRIRAQDYNHEPLLRFLRTAVPFYERAGGISIRLFQNVDDPSRFIEIVEYENQQAHDRDQVRVVSDRQMQSYIQSWHAILDGPPEVETYRDITEQIRGSDDHDS